MNELRSMLVPLDTLPGWPEAQDPSILDVLGLLVGAPLLVVAIIAVITRIHHAAKGNMGTPAVANQPIWVNGRRIEPSTQDQGSRDAIEASHQVVGDRIETDRAAESAASTDEGVGGASARW